MSYDVFFRVNLYKFFKSGKNIEKFFHILHKLFTSCSRSTGIVYFITNFYLVIYMMRRSLLITAYRLCCISLCSEFISQIIQMLKHIYYKDSPLVQRESILFNWRGALKKERQLKHAHCIVNNIIFDLLSNELKNWFTSTSLELRLKRRHNQSQWRGFITHRGPQPFLVWWVSKANGKAQPTYSIFCGRQAGRPNKPVKHSGHTHNKTLTE